MLEANQYFPVDSALEPGEHKLYFEFEIDVNSLPPSFDDHYGKIWHRIKAVFRAPNLHQTPAIEEWIFQSTPVIDLNTHATRFLV